MYLLSIYSFMEIPEENNLRGSRKPQLVALCENQHIGSEGTVPQLIGRLNELRNRNRVHIGQRGRPRNLF